ncbi:MAG: LPS-assembly protein LptD [Nitrospinae bacterium]|nr:LPS-assembly protein LptD [Nitrospinota bacterium]
MAVILTCLAGWVPALQTAESPTPLYIQADYLERQPALHLLRLQGTVDIKYGESHILADTVELNTETGDGTAEGHVHYEDPRQQIAAERAEFNLFSRVGTLYQATGSLRGKIPVHRKGEAPQPVIFHLAAERVVRETEERFHIRRGSFTTCAGPSPAWQFKARDASVEMEAYAHLREATFWIKNVPVFYTPYFLYPTKTDRATGLLPPAFGTSDRLGFFLENRFFWAINEQSDSTVGVDYLSKRGIRPTLEYRYAVSDVDRGQFNGMFLDDDLTGKSFWKVSGTAQQALPGQVGAILALDLQSRENYDRTFEVTDLFLRTRREATSVLSLIRHWENTALELQAERREDIENHADERLARYPDVGLHLLPTPVPWGPWAFRLDTAATNFRFDRTAALGGDLDVRRFSVQPHLGATYVLSPWLSVAPFLGFQETLLDQAGQAAEVQSVAILGTELRGPQLFKVYGGEDTTRYKHLLEPSLTYTWIPPFSEKTRPQPFDLLDDMFPRNDMAFSLTNRVLVRTQAVEDRVEVREIGLLRVSQGIDLRGQRGAEFTRIAPGPFFADLSVEARAELTRRLTLRADAAYDYEQHRIDIANARLTFLPLSSLTLTLDRRFRRAPDIDFINGGMTLNLPQGWHLSYAAGYNARDKTFAGNSFTAAYRPQCWNISVNLTQRQDETRVTFQIGLEGLAGPKLGF